MFVITVNFEIKPEHIDAFRDVIATQAENSLKLEPACRQFDVCFDPHKPERCFLYEKYDDEAAFGVHRGTDHFKVFSEKVAPMIASKTIGSWIEGSQ